MSVCCECCVLSGRDLCDELITRPEESYRLWCVWVWSWSVVKWGGLGPQRAVAPLEKEKFRMQKIGGANPVATYGAECWTLTECIAKRLTACDRNVIRMVFGGVKVSDSWRKWCNKELMQLFGDLDILSLVRVSRLNLIGYINRMDSKRKVSQVFNNNPQGSRLRGRPKNRCWNFVQILIRVYAKLKTGKEVKKQSWLVSPLRRRRSALDCSPSEKKKKNKNKNP
jgi:hypothetical protein